MSSLSAEVFRSPATNCDIPVPVTAASPSLRRSERCHNIRCFDTMPQASHAGGAPCIRTPSTSAASGRRSTAKRRRGAKGQASNIHGRCGWKTHHYSSFIGSYDVLWEYTMIYIYIWYITLYNHQTYWVYRIDKWWLVDQRIRYYISPLGLWDDTLFIGP